MESSERRGALSPVAASYVMAVLAFPFGLAAGIWLLSRGNRHGALVVSLALIVGIAWIALLT